VAQGGKFVPQFTLKTRPVIIDRFNERWNAAVDAVKLPARK